MNQWGVTVLSILSQLGVATLAILAQWVAVSAVVATTLGVSRWGLNTDGTDGVVLVMIVCMCAEFIGMLVLLGYTPAQAETTSAGDFWFWMWFWDRSPWPGKKGSKNGAAVLMALLIIGLLFSSVINGVLIARMYRRAQIQINPKKH